jgi:zinc protease
MGKQFKRIIIALPLLAIAIPATASTGHPAPPKGVERTTPWNSDKTDLPVDGSIIYGRLPNGLRYAIRPNNRPQNQVLVRMAFDFGSAAEADDEQGLAHFIEHMAFNGSTNVPEGEMVKMLERLGLAFGADTNASTGYTMTDYRLDLPKADAGLIERALFLMRETASEVTFDPSAVERERGVVIAEMRQRENFQFQSYRAEQELLYPNSYFSMRYPIGKKEVLENAPAERLKALYRKWYTPDRARIVVVGPIDPVAIEKEIVRKFDSWKGSSAALGRIDQCSFDNSRNGDTALFVHPEINESLTVGKLVADQKRPDNFNSNLLSLKMAIASNILQERIYRKTTKEETPYLGGGSSFSAGFCDKHARIGFSMTGKDGSWQQLMPLAEQMTRQAVDHGFSAREVADQIKRFDASIENAKKAESTRPSQYYANMLTRLDDSNVITSASQQHLVWLQARPFLTADSISTEFAGWFGQLNDPSIFVATRNANGADTAALANAFKESRKVAVAAPVQRQAQDWAYTDFGPAGTIASDKTIADLGIRTIRFANGVLLNLKKTDFEADRIRWSMRIDGGQMLLGNDQPQLGWFMPQAYISGGLGKYDFDDLRPLLAGSTAWPSLSVSADHFSAGGSVAKKDLELQMQLQAALYNDPGKRDEAIRLYKRGLPEFYSRLDATPQSALGIALGRIMNDNDPRFSIMSQEKAEAVGYERLDAALGDALKTNRLEIGLTGAIDVEDAIAIVSRTFGALPERKAEAKDFTEQRKANWSTATGIHDIPHRGEANQLSWRRVWTTTDDSDYRLQHALDILSSVVQIRLIDELREKLGATYGSSVDSDMSSTYPGRGTFTITTDGDPKDLAAIEAAVEAVIGEVVKGPVGADLFERARKPTLESYADWKKQNGTWSRLVAEAQTDPRRLERFRIGEEQFKSITAAEVHAAAKRVFEGKASYTFRAIPAVKSTN